MSFGGGNGGGGTISGSTDVALSNPADGQVLTYNGTLGKWKNAAASGGISPSTVTAKGDLIAGTGAGTVTNLPVGSNGQALVADSTQTSGLNYTSVRTVYVGDTAPTGTINVGDVWIDTSGS